MKVIMFPESRRRGRGCVTLFDGSSRLLSKSAQFDGLSNESSQLGFKFESDHVPRMRERGERGMA